MAYSQSSNRRAIEKAVSRFGAVVSCCEDCNIAKMKRSATDFIDHCRRVTEHQARAAVA